MRTRKVKAKIKKKVQFSVKNTHTTGYIVVLVLIQVSCKIKYVLLFLARLCVAPLVFFPKI